MAEQLIQLKKKDFETDQDVRWCPGCGDYSVLAAVQKVLPDLGTEKEKYVFVSGIGCSSRFPYYMNTYGFHSIHGRAPAFVTGIRLSNPDLKVWMITGDGDCLSIGGNHILHLLRRNVDTNVLLFNNKIYGLTKGQYSPTSEVGKKTSSTPFGSIDHPVNPLRFAMGADASFIARSLDVDAKLMAKVLKEGSEHKGTSFIEVFQNCNIFNDKAWESVADRKTRPENQLIVEHGKPLIFGKDKDKGIAFNSDFSAKIVNFESGSEQAAIDAGVCVHDSSNRILAQMLVELSQPEFPVPMGVLYKKPRPCFEDNYHVQEKTTRESANVVGSADSNLEKLFNTGNTWEV